METLLNNYKVSELKEIAKVYGIKLSGLKKADLIRKISENIEIVNNGSYITFDRANCTGTIVNTKGFIPNGCFTGHSIMPIKTKGKVKEFLCNAHANYVMDCIKNEDIDAINNSIETFTISEEAKILKLECLKDYIVAKMLFGIEDNDVTVEGLNTVTFIDYNNASKYIDGILFTKELVRSLSNIDDVNCLPIEYSTLLMFNGRISDISTVSHSVALIKETTKDIEESKAIKVKKKQYSLLKVNIADLEYDSDKDLYVVKEDAGVFVGMSENRMFRKYGYKDNGINKVPFVAFEANPKHLNTLSTEEREIEESKNEIIILHVIMNGFYDRYTGNIVKVCAQSASQARKGNYYFSSVDFDTIQNDMLCGYDFGEEYVMATKQARCGLAFTSAIPVAYKPRIKVLNDPCEIVKACTVSPSGVDKDLKVVKPFDKNGKPMIEKNNTLENKKFTPNDGGGLIEVLPAIQISYELGLISKKQRDYFYKNYNGEIDDIKNNSKLLKIFNIIPKAFQIRYAGDKGLLCVFPFRKYRPDFKDYDIIEGSNMRKYELSNYDNITLEIALYSHKGTEEVNTSYQFLQALNIKPEDLIELAERNLSKIDKDILTNPISAMKFLGMIERINAEEDKGITSKCTKVIASNPDMLHDKYINDKIKELLDRYIYQIAFGTIQVKGSYYYGFSDPFHFLGEGNKNVNGLTDLSMKKGQNYCNNKVATVGCFRSPLIHMSEPQKINLCENELLWFMQDIIVFNPYELTLPACGGADTDGDKFAIIEEEIIVNSIVDYDYIPYNIDIKANKGHYNKDNVHDSTLEYFLTTSKKGEIGLIANRATNVRDQEFTRKMNFDNYILALLFLSGWEIDRAKTGITIDMNGNTLNSSKKPHWHVLSTLFRKSATREMFLSKAKSNLQDLYRFDDKTYISTAPLGKLCDYTLERAKGIYNNDIDIKNFSNNLISNVNPDEVNRLLDTIKDIEANYRKEIAKIFTAFDSDDNNKINTALDVLNNEYRNILYSLSDDGLALAYASYYITYNRPNNSSSSRSFTWNVLFDEMLELIIKCNKSSKLVRLPKDIKTDKVLVSNANIMFSDMKSYGKVDIVPGVYNTITIENDRYILTSRMNNIVENEKLVLRNDEKLYQLELRGFARNGFNALEIIEILTNSKSITVQEINSYLQVVADKKIISGLASEHAIVNNAIRNKRLEIVKCEDPIYTPKNIREDMHWYSIEENKAIRKSLTITVKVIDEMKREEAYQELSSQTLTYTDVQYDNYNNYYDIECQADYNSYEDYSNPIGLDMNIIEAITLSFDNVWTVNSLDLPDNATKIDVNITDCSMNDGLKGNIVLYSGDKGFTFNIEKNNRNLIVNSEFKIKEENEMFLKRYFAYSLVQLLLQ